MTDPEIVWIASHSYTKMSQARIDYLRRSEALTTIDNKLCLNPYHSYAYEEILIILGKEPQP